MKCTGSGEDKTRQTHFIRNSTVANLIIPSELSLTQVTIPMGQSFLLANFSMTRTTSPIFKQGFLVVHLRLSVSVSRYSCLQRDQNWFARYWTLLYLAFPYRSRSFEVNSSWAGLVPSLRVSKVCGVSGVGSFGSLEVAHSSVLLTMLEASAKIVVNSS